MQQETQRIHHYLAPSTEQKLKVILDNELINAHVHQLVNSHDKHVSTTDASCSSLLTDDKIDDLRRLYFLLSRIPSTLDVLRDCVGEYTKQIGLQIVPCPVQSSEATSSTSEHSTAVLFIQQILGLRSKLDGIIKESFRDDKKIQQKVQDAFDYFINYKDSQNLRGKHDCALHLALYLDELLRNGLKNAADIEYEIDRAMVIFRRIADKDLFECFYKQYLSKRLLQSKSVSDDAEKLVLARLKSECGYQFTSKLEGMFKDIHMSKALMEEFRKPDATPMTTASEPLIAPRHLPSRDIEVQVLTAGYWPLQNLPTCRLPLDIQESVDYFSNFYLSRNSGKKLSWLFHLGNIDIRANFRLGRRELNVSTYQSCILMLFNQADSLSLRDIQDLTQITDSELRRHLLSLCTPKMRILKKSTTTKASAFPNLTLSMIEISGHCRRGHLLHK